MYNCYLNWLILINDSIRNFCTHCNYYVQYYYIVIIIIAQFELLFITRIGELISFILSVSFSVWVWECVERREREKKNTQKDLSLTITSTQWLPPYQAELHLFCFFFFLIFSILMCRTFAWDFRTGLVWVCCGLVESFRAGLQGSDWLLFDFAFDLEVLIGWFS